MQRRVPRVLYVCTPSHTQQVFRQEDYTRLQTYFDFEANPSERNMTADEVAERIAGVDALITGWGAPPLTPAVLERANRLRLIAHSAGSVKRLLEQVIETIRERKIRVFSANRAIALNVAETTVGAMIFTVRRWYDHITHTRSGGWRTPEIPKNGQFLRGATVGLVSASTVAREVIPLLHPFDVQILVYDPYLSEYEAGRLGVERVESLDELFARSDIVSLHAPSIPATRHMVGEEQLRRLRPGAVLINTARGSILDHDALVRVAEEGRIWVFLDVTTPEPLPSDHPLRRLPNVYITPHTAGAGYYGYFRIGAWTVQAVENFFAGRPFAGEVDLSRWETLA